jgi:hypothetical protein
MPEAAGQVARRDPQALLVSLLLPIWRFQDVKIFPGLPDGRNHFHQGLLGSILSGSLSWSRRGVANLRAVGGEMVRAAQGASRFAARVLSPLLLRAFWTYGRHPPPHSGWQPRRAPGGRALPSPGWDSVFKERHRPLRGGSWSERLEASGYTDGPAGALSPGVAGATRPQGGIYPAWGVNPRWGGPPNLPKPRRAGRYAAERPSAESVGPAGLADLPPASTWG